MNEQLLTIIIAVISSTAISAIIIKLLEHDKQKADIKSVGVHDDVNIGELGLKYAKEFKEELAKLKKINEKLESENTRLEILIDDLKKRVDQLVEENELLREEIKKLKG